MYEFVPGPLVAVDGQVEKGDGEDDVVPHRAVVRLHRHRRVDPAANRGWGNFNTKLYGRGKNIYNFVNNV